VATHYRPDIDGLRALAVVSVVLFHLEIAWFPGGFVGVDVFFVISGYLITAIIVGQVDRQRFSILGFFERRARRILPALFVMIAATTALASLVMIPPMFRLFGASVVAAAASVSNLFFWYAGGYFTVAASSRPFLHTWSLGVEEQFYILFPLLLLLFRRWSRLPWVAIVLPLALCSFAFAVYEVRAAPRAAFFLPFSRFWELMLGSLLAIGAVPAVRRRALAELLGLLGLALILAAVLFFDDRMRFPGEAALVPCLGAVLVIHAGRSFHGFAARLLSLRPVVFVGLISYSLYLWHWPLIVLVRRFLLQRELAAGEMLLLMTVVVGLSVLSWRFVEQPFRRPDGTPPVRTLSRAVLASALVAAVGAGLWVTHGLPGRFGQQALQLAMGADDRNPMREACDSPAPAQIRRGEVCTIGNPDARPSFAVVGDSFGDAVVPGIEAAALRAGTAGLVLTRAGCNPLFGVREEDPACAPVMEAVASLLGTSSEIRAVLFIGRWTRIAEGTRFGARDMVDVFITDDQSETPGFDENRRVFVRAIDRLAAMLPGKDIFVAAYFPEQMVHVPQAAFVQAVLGGTPDIGVPRAAFDQRQRFVRQVFAEAEERLGIQVLDVGSQLCGRDRCRAVEDGRALYFDDNHLSRYAAVKYSQLFDPVVRTGDGNRQARAAGAPRS
jgi:peptidoglycan/LPS O-acetylase OafA/YrhL